jgi:hypothetical protein
MVAAVGSARAAIASAPHAAVARIIVPERSATSYGTGTLIDVRDQYGLVVTNWHVVRDASAPPEVVFPNGFRCQARPLKLDANWDLAALVIWRPPIEPVAISREPPRPGDRLTICGYGQGEYRAVSGRCTQYYAPRVDFPHELLELDVEARQGDSGGPIFNEQGELAGVLFGAGRGTTMGSYGGRVHSFLTSLAPDIGQAPPQQVVTASPPALSASGNLKVAARPPQQHSQNPATLLPPQAIAAEPGPADRVASRDTRDQQGSPGDQPPIEEWPSPVQAVTSAASSVASAAPAATDVTPAAEALPLASLPSTPAAEPLTWRDVAGRTWLAQFTTVLAIIGAIALVVQLAKLAT